MHPRPELAGSHVAKDHNVAPRRPVGLLREDRQPPTHPRLFHDPGEPAITTHQRCHDRTQLFVHHEQPFLVRAPGGLVVAVLVAVADAHHKAFTGAEPAVFQPLNVGPAGLCCLMR